MSAIIALAFCCAIVPAALWVWNMAALSRAWLGQLCGNGNCVLPDAVSVLIPARNEERVIAASLASLLASRGVQIEIIVLDDGSTDRTAEIVLKSLSRMRACACALRLRCQAAGMASSTPATRSLKRRGPVSSAFSMQMCVLLPTLWRLCRRSWCAPALTWSAVFPDRRRKPRWSGYCCR